MASKYALLSLPVLLVSGMGFTGPADAGPSSLPAHDVELTCDFATSPPTCGFTQASPLNCGLTSLPKGARVSCGGGISDCLDLELNVEAVPPSLLAEVDGQLYCEDPSFGVASCTASGVNSFSCSDTAPWSGGPDAICEGISTVSGHDPEEFVVRCHWHQDS